MLTKTISELAAGAASRGAEIPVNIGGQTFKLTVEQVLRVATPADSGSAAAVHSLLSHAVAGLTAGHVLVATGPTTFEFRKLTEFHLPNPADIDIKGNAATTSRLLNPRTVAGVMFDGTTDVAIPHGNLADVGDNTHAQLDAHVADDARHRMIDDAGTAATVLWSAARIIAQLATKAATGHLHAGTYEPANANIQAHIADAGKHRTINDAGTAATDLWSAAQIVAQLATKAASGHNHAGTYEPANANIQAHIADAGKHRTINDAGTTATDLWSAAQIIAQLAAKADTLTLIPGSGIAISTDPETGAVTIANTGGGVPGPHGHTGPADGGAFTALSVAGNPVWHAGNDGSGSGLDADTVDGMQPASASTGSTVVSRDANGDFAGRYITAVYLNMSHAAATRNGDTVFFSSTDAYIRKNTRAGMLASLGLANAWTADNDGPESGMDADTVDGKHADELGSPALRVLMAQQFGAF